MVRARRKDCHIPRLSASFRSSELLPTATARDAKDLVDAGMIVGIVVAVAPRLSPAVAVKQLLEHSCGVERLRQPDRALVMISGHFG